MHCGKIFKQSQRYIALFTKMLNMLLFGPREDANSQRWNRVDILSEFSANKGRPVFREQCCLPSRTMRNCISSWGQEGWRNQRNVHSVYQTFHTVGKDERERQKGRKDGKRSQDSTKDEEQNFTGLKSLEHQLWPLSKSFKISKADDTTVQSSPEGTSVDTAIEQAGGQNVALPVNLELQRW